MTMLFPWSLSPLPPSLMQLLTTVILKLIVVLPFLHRRCHHHHRCKPHAYLKGWLLNFLSLDGAISPPSLRVERGITAIFGRGCSLLGAMTSSVPWHWCSSSKNCGGMATAVAAQPCLEMDLLQSTATRKPSWAAVQTSFFV